MPGEHRVRGDGFAVGEPPARLVAVPGNHVFRSISVGGLTYVGLDEAGVAWQGVFFYDQATLKWTIGSPFEIDRSRQFKAARVATSFASNSGTESNVCLLDDAGAVHCRGWNSYGQLGNGELRASGSLRGIALGVTATQLAVGDSHVCALQADGSVWCWGSNSDGELGAIAPAQCDLGANIIVQCTGTPTRVDGLQPARRVWAGTDLSCAETMDNAIWCWGQNKKGQLGNATQQPFLTKTIAP